MRLCALFDNDSSTEKGMLACWLLDEKNFVRAATIKDIKRPVNPVSYPNCHVRELSKEESSIEPMEELEAIDVFEHLVDEHKLILINPKELSNEFNG